MLCYVVRVERVSGGANVLWTEVEVLLDAVDHAAAACVDAEVVDAALEVRDVRVDLHALEHAGFGEALVGESDKHPEDGLQLL